MHAVAQPCQDHRDVHTVEQQAHRFEVRLRDHQARWRSLACLSSDCIKCQALKEQKSNECSAVGNAGDTLMAVRIGSPEVSVQFHQNPSCPNWHDRKQSNIWQQDVFVNDCFPSWAPIARNDLQWGLVAKEQGQLVLKACMDSICRRCQTTPYKLGVCETASYVGFPSKSEHKSIRVKTWQANEAATIYDAFPECAERVEKVQELITLTEDAIAKTDAVNSLAPSCPSPKQDKEMTDLGSKLRNALTWLRP